MKRNEAIFESNKTPLQQVLAEGAAWLLASLFIYTAVSKVYDWQGTKLAMYNQLFPEWMADILLFTLPVLELGLASMLLVSDWRKTGLLLSVLLLILFTGYVGYIGLGLSARVPCSCGGVLNSLDWGEHLLFNLAFLAIAGYGLWFERQKSPLA
ncbi:MauE/DoxX family redox-associated membrane protein [Algoriphagus sp.]|uniref:MauE/DoxX family redox-associated membrane protein n=1 Tax=Algoriphagus sp. TaxID=1872435 RepID=UPI003F6F98E9